MSSGGAGRGRLATATPVRISWTTRELIHLRTEKNVFAWGRRIAES
jgi:hypothetical protein